MKKALCGVLTLALCLVLALGLAGRAEGADIYFMSVNDTMLEFKASTMPVRADGVLYIPYSMLSPTLSGINLGVGAMYSRAQNQAVVYSNENLLVFDIDGNITYDSDGKEYAERAIVRNAMVYLPIARICALFPELKYSATETEYGTLVRVKNSSVVLSDEAFIAAVSDNMELHRARYEQELAAQPTEPSSTPSSGDVGYGASVYPAFDVGGEGVPEALLAALEQRECRGLFFFDGAALADWDDLVRQLVGRGHLIGLKLSAATADEAREELERGAGLLRLTARCRATAVLAEGLSAADRQALEAEGWICWVTTADGRGLTGSATARANRILQQLEGGADAHNHLLLGTETGAALSTVLSAIRGAGYLLRAPVSTVI